MAIGSADKRLKSCVRYCSTVSGHNSNHHPQHLVFYYTTKLWVVSLHEQFPTLWRSVATLSSKVKHFCIM